MEQLFLRGLLCSSTSLAVVNEVLDYCDRKHKLDMARSGKWTHGNVGSSQTLKIVGAHDRLHMSRQKSERKQEPSQNDCLSNMCDAVNGIGEDVYFNVSSNLKTCKVSELGKWYYQEGRKEWEAFIKYGMHPMQTRSN